mmetsp:Transcript_34980/g.89383  ORF Transcript_34980/g.89383 Transcript_34980/m.89383 type:complete len:185 (+) Transcript_34980:2006-2560(+)
MALKWLRLASDNGNHDARRMVGDYLWYGTAADPPDIPGAIKQYEISALGGDLQSAFNLAYTTYWGVGKEGGKGNVTEGIRIARNAYNIAAQKGSSEMYPNLLMLIYLTMDYKVEEFVQQVEINSRMYFSQVYNGWIFMLQKAGGKSAKFFFEKYIPEILLTFTLLNIVLIQSLCSLISRRLRRR